MKTLRGCALLFGLLVVGVLIALLPSEAAALPSITIAGASPANLNTRACDAGYTACYIIPTGTYGGWIVGNVSGTNTARLMIADNAGSGTATDKMKITGITFEKTGGGQFDVVFTNTFDAASNIANDFQFALTSGGWFVPLPNTETTRNDRVRLRGCGRLTTSTTCATLPGAKDTTAFQTLATDHGNTSWTFSQSASSVGNCNTTGSPNNRCAPYIEETMTINTQGNDRLVLDGSYFENFGTCREEQGHPPNVPPGPAGVPCKALINKMEQENAAVLRDEIRMAEAANATPFIPCTDEEVCGGDEQDD